MHPDPKRQRANPSRDTSSNLSMIVCTFSLSIRLKSGKIPQDIRKLFTGEFSIWNDRDARAMQLFNHMLSPGADRSIFQTWHPADNNPDSRSERSERFGRHCGVSWDPPVPGPIQDLSLPYHITKDEASKFPRNMPSTPRLCVTIPNPVYQFATHG